MGRRRLRPAGPRRGPDLEDLIGRPLDATVAYQHPTIESLAEYVINGPAELDEPTDLHTFRERGAGMEFDVAVQTVSPQLELLNTTAKDNNQFYGRAWGAGSFVLLGPQYDMKSSASFGLPRSR